MIPIVYGKSDSERTTNGLGRLTDCIECTVKNNAEDYSCELHIVYPYDGFHAEIISYANIIGVQIEPHGNIQLFDVYRISQNESGQMEIDAHHVRHRLKDMPTTFVYGSNIANVIRSLNMIHIGSATYGRSASQNDGGTYAGTKNFCYPSPFVFWTNINKTSPFFAIRFRYNTAYGNEYYWSESVNKYRMTTSEDVSFNFWDALFGDNGLITVFGLSVKFDNFNVYIGEPEDLTNDRSEEVIIQYGKDLQEFSVEVDASDYELYTHAIPYHKYQHYVGNDSDGDNIYTDAIEFYMENPDSASSSPIVVPIPNVPLEMSCNRYVPVDISNTKYERYYVGISGISRTAFENAVKRVSAEINTKKISPAFEISVTELRNNPLYEKYKKVEHLSLNDIISVGLEPLDMYVQEQVLQTTYDVLSERSDEILVGLQKLTLPELLSNLAGSEKTESDDGTLISHSTNIGMYTETMDILNHTEGDYVWKVEQIGKDLGGHLVEKSGRLTKITVAITPIKMDGDAQAALDGSEVIPANTSVMVSTGYPKPANEDIVMTNGKMTVSIDSNGNMYFTAGDSDVELSEDNFQATQHFYHPVTFNIMLEYLSKEDAVSSGWKNYITTTSADWKERDSE